jgi:DNA (cytosine-5)-methyltransferase 1
MKNGMGFVVGSFFSGAGGLDEGFKKEGFKILFANDTWNDACKTFSLNHKDTKIFNRKIEDLSNSEIQKVIQSENIKHVDVVIGGPPCQGFTRLNNEFLIKNTKDVRRDLFMDYIKRIAFIKPRLVFMENVPDISIRKNGEGEFYRDLVLREFEKIGYFCKSIVLNAADYNVPQERKRMIFIATNTDRLKNKIERCEDFFNEMKSRPPASKLFLNKLKKHKTIENQEITVNGPITFKRIKKIPQGGYYEHLPDNLKTKKIRNGKEVIVKRYGGYLRRVHPDLPAKTITNNYIIHPLKNRFLTNREKAVLHSFPIEYKFYGSLGSVSQQIANAVPPNLANVLAKYAKYLLE